MNGAMTDAEFDRIRRRLALAEEDIRERPFSHPVAAAWYYEDVSRLLRELEATRG